jgi:hypothetical protein
MVKFYQECFPMGTLIPNLYTLGVILCVIGLIVDFILWAAWTVPENKKINAKIQKRAGIFCFSEFLYFSSFVLGRLSVQPVFWCRSGIYVAVDGHIRPL